MPPLRQPLALEKLTLAAVSEYVHTIGQIVFNAICSKSSTSLPMPRGEILKKQTFNLVSLSTALYRGIPHVLWFDVRVNVLAGINQLIKGAPCTADGFRTTGDQICQKFVEQLIVALVGPQVTHMDFTGHTQFLRQVLIKNLDRMQHLKVLKLIGVEPTDVVKEHIALLTSLTSFTMEQKCTDDIVEVLSQNCKKLQTLNITGSPGVTDRSVVNIMKLQNLQHLQISCTRISERGVLYILSQPTKIGGCVLKEIYTLKNLQTLGCGHMRNEQLHAITCSFTKLTHLSFSTVRCDFKILSQMKQLKEFKVSCGNFIMDNMGGLLEALGHQLEVLDLLMVQDVNLAVIATHCVNLNSLSLRSCSVAPLPQTPGLLTKSDKELPFRHLEHLTFYVSCSIKFLEFILIRCMALRCLVIGQMREVDDNFLSSCLARNSLKHLELFKVYFGAQISVRSVCLLLETCPNLSVLGGLGTLDKIEQDELGQLIESLKHKNYNINVVI